jgi:eukaryotic-like serine/threonine-protein kinase
MGNDSPANSNDSLIGRIVVERGLATASEVQECLELQRKARAAAEKSSSGDDGDAADTSLANILLKRGYITKRQLERLGPSAEDSKVASQQIPGFQILGKLGAGAMATVYKARQLSLDRIVAIKILPKKYTKSPEFIDRFYAEGKAAAKLNHPHIVGALDVGKVGDTHYFVMEFVDGHTLFDEIASGKQYDEAEVLRIAIQVVRALHHAHKAGFVHRDVKPKNIMITLDGVAKLADMGLARAVSDREAAEAEQGKAYGTPYYISPEQIRGEVNVDGRADIYSLGATLYHMVTGKVPFEGTSPSAVMHKHLKAKLVPADELNPNASSGLCEIIEVCMAKDRNKRYASAGELLEDLEAVARGEAPHHARKRFDLAGLASLEPDEQAQLDRLGETARILYQSTWVKPLIWAAATGWGFAVIMVIILIIKLG